MKQVKEFFAFVKERHAIYERRQAGKPKPWTKDPILQSYRFCNMYRELDTVTIWIRENWRDPWKADPNVWFAMVVARVVNWPDSLEAVTAAVGTPKKIQWKPEVFVREMDARMKAKSKCWTGAYMIHADAAPGLSKAAYYAERVLTPLWDARKNFLHGTLEESHKWLRGFRDMGSFMAAQVIADVKYTPLLAYASDWWSFAAPGPGSLRGLSRVETGALGKAYTDASWKAALDELHLKMTPLLDKAGMPRMHAQDLQNATCEFDKWERVRLGEGKPRSKYPGGA